MKFYTMLAASLISFLSACNSTGNKEVQADSSNAEIEEATVRDENAFPREDVALINETAVSKYVRSAIPELDWGRFAITRFWKEEFFINTPFTPDDEFFAVYGQFLKYSPDSSRFIDLDSYNIDIRKERNGRLVGRDDGPDTEVSFVDLNKKQRTRLLFLGPGNSVEDAAWIDNNNLLLIGFQENASATGTNAVVWKFDLATKMVNLYELSDKEIVLKLKDYTKNERLKNVMVR